MDEVRVLVVGAGPTGLVAALLLAAHGVGCTVVERRRDVVATPRAVHLDGAALRILQQVGLAEAVAAIGRSASGLRLLDARRRPFAEFRHDRAVGDHGHPDSTLFDQPDLERLLRAEVARRAPVTLRGGLEVVGLEQRPGAPVTVTLRDTATGSTERLRAGVVLGCDGAASTTRDAIGAALRDLGFSQRWFVLDVRCPRPLPTWGGVDQLCDPRRAATFVALPGDRYRWEFRMRPDETVEGLTARVAELTAPWRAGVGAAELEVLRAAGYTFRAAVADRWRDRRVLLLGDAAHLTPPFIGQGLGLGLGDAHNLVWKLATVLGPAPADEAALLDSYQRERAPHAAAVVRGALRVGRAMTGGGDVAAALRRPLAGLLLRLPGVRTRARRGIAVRYRANTHLDRRRHRRDLTGTVCPQPSVRLDGRAVRLDDVLGGGYALLVVGPVPAALRARAHRLGARVVRVQSGDAAAGAAPGEVSVVDDGAVPSWLRGGRAAAALLRPDRVVCATAPIGF